MKNIKMYNMYCDTALKIEQYYFKSISPCSINDLRKCQNSEKCRSVCSPQSPHHIKAAEVRGFLLI